MLFNLSIMFTIFHYNCRTKCFSVEMFDTSSSSACPAFCKINNKTSYSNYFCSGNTVANLKVEVTTNNERAVLIKSPKHSCNRKYRRNFMCIYSVRMSCSANRLVVSHSDIDMAENDYIQVIDSSRSIAYSPVTGDSWPSDQQHYPSSDLKVVFWSDHEKPQGKGFSLQFSCPSSTTEEIPSQQPGSGESTDILTTA